jgi:hypothetical protein
MSYDSRAVKIPKSIKCEASFITDRERRNFFIKTHVQLLEQQVWSRTRRNRDRDHLSSTTEESE